MALVAGACVAHARLVGHNLVRAGADAGGRVVLAAIRLDHQVIVGHHIGQVGIRFLQLDDDVAAISLDGIELGDEGQRRRFRVLVAMALQRRHDVLRRQLLAVVEGHALADLEGPGLGVV
jgi:hypothetical protein